MVAQESGRIVITEHDLEKRLWAAANALRGPIDPANFRALAVALPLSKSACDQWNHGHLEATDEPSSERTARLRPTSSTPGAASMSPSIRHSERLGATCAPQRAKSQALAKLYETMNGGVDDFERRIGGELV